ncbi:MAG: pitrilysin family protein [Acidobacteriota bacterium]
MHRLICKSFILLFLFISFLCSQTLAQSGRGRPVNPARNPGNPAATPAQPVTVPEATSVIKQEQLANTARFVLKNGITVIIREAHAYPLVAVEARFKTGLFNEPESAKGFSALVARMMFRGTQFRKAEQILSDTRAIGILMNDASAYEHTSINLISPQNKIKEALAIQADLLQNPLFAAEDLSRELALNEDVFTTSLITAREKAGAFFDAATNAQLKSFNPENYSVSRLLNLSQNISSGNFQLNPQITREQLLEFYQSHFRPDNLIITVVGDVVTFNVLVEIQRLYGTFKIQPVTAVQPTPATTTTTKGKPAATQAASTKSQAPKPSTATNPSAKPGEAANQPSAPSPAKLDASGSQTSAPTTAPAPPTEALRYGNERGDIGQSIVNVGFQVAGFNTKEWVAIELLNAIMAQGRGSRLHRSLVQEQALASHIESNYLPFAEKGFLFVRMLVPPSGIDKAEATLFRELNLLRREIPAASEMARAKMLLEKRFFETTNDYATQAALLAHAEAAQGGIRAHLDYLKTLRAVTAEDVQRIAAKYLALINTSAYEYESGFAPPRSFDAAKFSETVLAWAPSFAEPVDAKQVRSTAESAKATVNATGVEKSADQLGVLESMQPLEVKNFSTLHGPQAYVKENHTKPIVSVAFLFQGGRMIEDETNSGVTELMLRSMLYGSTKRPQTASQLEEMGAEIAVINEADFYGLQVNVLSPNAEAALRMVRELIEDPAFDDDYIKKAINEQIGFIHRDRNAAMIRAGELFQQALFPNHTYGFPAHGREEVVSKLTGEFVREWHARTIKRQVPFIIIVGDTNGSSLITSEIATGFRRNETDSALKARVTQPVKPEEKIVASRLSQTYFTMGFPAAKGDSADTVALALVEALMNGKTGRLMAELRTRQGLVNHAFLDHQAMKITGTITAQFVSSVENESRARAVLVAELEKLTKTALSADELASAKAIATTTNLLAAQSYRSNIFAYARAVCYQKPVAEVDMLEERLNKSTADEVKRIFAGYFKPATLWTGIVRGTQSPKPNSQ